MKNLSNNVEVPEKRASISSETVYTCISFKNSQKRIVSTSSLVPVCPQVEDMTAWMGAINQVLKRFSDKDWNYSRIMLTLHPLMELAVPYVMGIDWLDVRGKQGKAEYQASQSEITWGMRHSHELGILEIVSLRLNHALSELTTANDWQGIRPVIRLPCASA